MSVAIAAMLLGIGVILLASIIVAVRPYAGTSRRHVDTREFRSPWRRFRPKDAGKRPE